MEELTELQIETQCIEYAESLPGCLVCKTPTVGKMIGRKRIKARKSEKKGKSDAYLCYHGFYIAVEFKKVGGIQSEDQEKFEEEVILAGGQYWLIDSLDEFIFKIGTFKW